MLTDSFWNPQRANFQPSYLSWNRICLCNSRTCILILLHSCFTFPSKNDSQRKNLHNRPCKTQLLLLPPQNRRQNKRIDKHPHRLKKQTNKLFQLIQNEVLKQVNSCFICETRMEWGLQLNSCSRCVQLLFRADSAAQEIVCSV